MNWIKGSKAWFKPIECVNPYKGIYYVNITPRVYTPTEDEKASDLDMEYINLRLDHKPSLHELKDIVLGVQSDFDSSNEVNGFRLNGMVVWLDKSTRVGLVNSLTIQKENGDTESTLWLEGNPFTVNIEVMLQALKAIELYASQCYNNTQKHIAEIRALNTQEELLSYDVSVGYPKQLEFTL